MRDNGVIAPDISDLAGDLRDAIRSAPALETGERARMLERIDRSILSPLGVEASSGHTEAAPDAAARALAVRLTAARSEAPAVLEATAAAQELAIELAQPATQPDLLDELRSLQRDIPPTIRLSPNGPLLVTNIDDIRSHLGEPLPVLPQMALCRCGESGIKPRCDGSHATCGFDDAKDPERIPDRRDTYVGQQVTILDNRGTCQHAGFCSDRIATAFRVGQEPFVKPSGGRMDELIRAVRDCPSGALSYAIDGVEARDEVDRHGGRSPAIEVSKDGPYRVTGAVRLVDADGANVPRNEGASREHYALCRCGHALNKPFCTGMHWYVGFRDPEPGPEHRPTMFEWAGGLPALTRMTRLFYEKHVPQDPLLAPLFADMAPDHPERVAKWLGEVFGGPPCYSEEHGGYPRMLAQHLGRCLTEEWRERWVTLLIRSLHEAGLPNDAEFISAFRSYIEWGSRLAVENSQTDSRPPQRMPMPHWDWTTGAGPPGSRVSALAGDQPHEEPAVTLPEPGEPVGFAQHIKALFRERDRTSMQFAFDLWSYEDVGEHAEDILERLRNGSMPCDGAWPDEQVAVFARWIAEGKRE
ncbi:MAG TPA: CDGSH iron-sulfur domain-containing protein [Thermoleophilaceae bacterium]